MGHVFFHCDFVQLERTNALALSHQFKGYECLNIILFFLFLFLFLLSFERDRLSLNSNLKIS